MRPLHIKATDFGSFGSLDIDLAGITLAAIVGENGAGKSTLLTAMRVALFGRAAGLLDPFVRQGANGFHLTFDFEVAGKTFRVVREQGKLQKASLSCLAEDGSYKAICEAKVKDVDESVRQMLGCDHDSFTLAFHLPQGGLGMFAALDPAPRKEWLVSKLPMGVWSQLEAEAKAEVSEADFQMTRCENGLAMLSAEAADIEALRQESERLEGAVAELEGEVSDAERSLAAVVAESERIKALQEASAQAERDLRRAEDVRETAQERCINLKAKIASASTPEPAAADVAFFRAAVDLASAQLNEKHTANDAHERLADALKAAQAVAQQAANAERTARDAHYSALARLKTAEDALLAAESGSAPCPTCGCSDPKHQGATRLENAKASVEAERSASKIAEGAVATAEIALVEAKRECEAADAALAGSTPVDLTPFVEAVSAARRALEVADETDAKHRAWEREQASVETLKSQLEAAEAEFATAKEAEALAGEESADRYQAYAVVSAMMPDVDEVRAKLEALRGALNADRSMAAIVAERFRVAESQAAKIAELTSELEAARSRHDVYAMLSNAYGKRGIQARLIESAVDRIADFANDFLARFTDGLAVEMVTQRENKTAGVRETLDILVTDASGTRPIERYSGGERTRVNFALAVGISRFLATTTDTHVVSFAVDEPEYLDTDGVAELVACLHILAESVPCVLLVSHIPGVSDSLPQRIEVRKGANGSSAKVVA